MSLVTVQKSQSTTYSCQCLLSKDSNKLAHEIGSGHESLVDGARRSNLRRMIGSKGENTVGGSVNSAGRSTVSHCSEVARQPQDHKGHEEDSS